jgi:CcmD family protein
MEHITMDGLTAATASNAGYAVAAYSIAATLVGGYVVYLLRRLRRANAELAELHDRTAAPAAPHTLRAPMVVGGR